MATNLDYNVNVNATNGIQALNNLQTKVSGLGSAFGGLKNAIAGLALGSIIQNVLSFADGIQDLSDATGIATNTIMGFQKAVSLAGGSADGADKAILRLTQNLGEARQGGADLQVAFSKVGVSLDDLRNMSEQQILSATLKGLEGISDKSVQAALKAQLLGKEFRNVATSGLAESLESNAAASAKYAESIKRAAELQDNLAVAAGKVKLAILEIIDPAAKFINALDQDALAKAIDGFTRLAAVIVAFTAFGKLVAIVEGLAIGFTGAAGAAALFGINILKNFTLIGRILTAVGALVIGFQTLFPETSKSISNALGEAIDATKEFFGIQKEAPDTTTTTNNNTAAVKENTQANKENVASVVEMPQAIKNLQENLKNTVGEYAKYNKNLLDGINLQTQLIGLTSEESRVRQTQSEITKKATEEIDKLQQKKQQLSDAEKLYGTGALIDQQIAAIEKQAAVDLKATEQAIKNSEARQMARKVEEFGIKSRIDLENQLQTIQDDIAKSTMPEIEQKYYDIEAAAKRSAKAAIEAEEARIGRKLTGAEAREYYDAAIAGTEDLKRAQKTLYDQSRTFSSGWSKAFREYADNATNAAKQAERLFQKATQGMEDLLVNFVKTGKFEWKGFVSMMLEELLRSQIQSVFAGLLGGMSGSMGGGGGILGALGGLFGGGGGGGSSRGGSPNSPLYVTDVSGGGIGGMGGTGAQQGGGIWDSITSMASNVWDGVKGAFGGITNTVSNVFGGIADTVGNVFGGIADTVGGIFSGGSGGGGGFGGGAESGGFLDSVIGGIGDFFGGFFANGGSLGAGKWGIAGENGPELISGPANISSMGGGTNVTYNINAVDAASFKQMLAQDPSFIYALSLQGGSGIAGRR
jgi:lambda family phage tail tape measure protein